MANAHACFCVGPQNGQPLCPCRMRGLAHRDDIYRITPNVWPWPWTAPNIWPEPTAADVARPIPGMPNPFPADDSAARVVAEPEQRCSGCGIKLCGAMAYSCPRFPCPSGLGSYSTL